MRNNQHTSTYSLRRFLILITLVLAAATAYFIFGDNNADPQFAGYLLAKQGKVNNTMIIHVQGKPDIPMHIRGYTAKVSFDPSKLSVVSIRYKLGVVSEALGDDNSTMARVNNTGVVKIMGEAHEQEGLSLKGNQKVTIAEIVVKKKTSMLSTVTLSSPDSAFYMITQDGRLTGVPMQRSATAQVK